MIVGSERYLSIRKAVTYYVWDFCSNCLRIPLEVNPNKHQIITPGDCHRPA